MKRLLNPKWIFLSNTLPIILLLFLEYSEYNIIKSLLDEKSIYLWTSFAIAVIVLAGCNIAYAIIQIKRKKRLSLAYGIISFLAYTIYIYSYYSCSSEIIPFNIPNWMISGNIFMYVGSFLIPTLIHSLFALAVILTPNAERETAWKNIIAAIMIPMAFYMLGAITLKLWDGSFFSDDAMILSVIAITALFLFFLLRAVYILLSKRKLYNYQLAWKIPVAFAFPIIGLLINDFSYSHLFGDFSNVMFYIITLLNATLLCLPSPEDKRLRLFLFGGRCATFIYTLYFFIIMLPFLPLSIIAIFVFGAGFLILTPLVLFPIHLNELVKDFNSLRRVYKKQIIYITAFTGLLILPVATTAGYLYDRYMLRQTLEYIYSPDYTKEYKLSANSVNKMLNTMDYRAEMSFYKSTPFLSSYYKWLVMDNLNLSDGKKEMMRNLFNGSVYNNNRSTTWRGDAGPIDINITDIKHLSEYDPEQKAWLSRIDLAITNGDTPLRNAEYKTNIELPAGCWISDYYLYVNDVKEPGILAEKKAATWIFNQIRNVNRDPGLLRYLQGNMVELKVFPFKEQETRLTGIEFIHKDPVQITIDGHILDLGNAQVQGQVSDNSTVRTEAATYISTEDKQKLETVRRKPYYHFIVDISANRRNEWYDHNNNIPSDTVNKVISDYIREIRSFMDKNPAGTDKKDARISYTNTYVAEAAMSTDWDKDLMNRKFEGGFFLDRAIKKILFNSYTNADNTYPIIIAVSNHIDKAILNYDFGDMKFTYPESDLFYSLQNNSLRAHTFAEGTRVIGSNVDSIPVRAVKAWPNPANPTCYLPDDGKPSIVLTTKDKTLNITQNDIKKKDWESGLQMQAQWMSQVLHPETADKEWLTLVQNSFKSGIMMSLTSYIVVENEAQKAMLKKKQEETLSGNRSLDLSDDTQRMPEPDLYIIALLFGLFFLYYRKKKR